MANKSDLLALLSRHIGADNGIGVEALARELDAEPRHVRTLVTELREGGTAVCAHPTTGYFIAANDAELERYYVAFLHARAMRSLYLICRVKNCALAELLGQMRLPT